MAKPAPEPPKPPEPKSRREAKAAAPAVGNSRGADGRLRPPLEPPPPSGQQAPATGGARAPASASRRAAAASPISNEAFPSLPRPGSAMALAPAGGGQQRGKRWGDPNGGDAAPEEELPESRVSREDAAKLIERQRAATAAAAAKLAGNTLGKAAEAQRPRCPICADPYQSAPGRRRTRRPCCNGELCVTCDHKSLRSGACYFCREASEEFPALGLACRVAS
mmetsp:Transcript_22194/g.63070  ORF Transcript_22194/g.63070 Transcript_22194/m.63070 type:complete len:222 (-) Transcript_22194:20-685(-)